jgi:hypothetical protein
MVSGFGFRVSGFGFRVSGFGFRVSGFARHTSTSNEHVPGVSSLWFLVGKKEISSFGLSVWGRGGVDLEP